MSIIGGIFGLVGRFTGYLWGLRSKVIIAGVVVGTGATFMSSGDQPALVLSSFGVPKDLEETGLTGDIVAARLKAAITHITVSDPANEQIADRTLSYGDAS